MLNIQIRPSLGLLKQIAKIEYLAGAWSRLRLNESFASKHRAEQASLNEAVSSLCLDGSTSAVLSIQLREMLNNGELPQIVSRETEGNATFQHSSRFAHSSLDEVNRLMDLAELPFTLSIDDLLQLKAATFENSGSEPEAAYRQQLGSLLDPNNRSVFPAISAFLIEKRLLGLIDWTQRELEAEILHPLLVIGTFHLLFLQILPFPNESHRIALLIMHKLLEKHGFDSVKFQPLTPLFFSQEEAYYNALRQAEKTAGSDWSTLNTWLEFFLDTMLSAGKALQHESELSFSRSRLSKVQEQILTVVKAHGSVTRDRVSKETGINLNTVKYNLSVLAQRGHLRRNGGGRTTNYSLI